MRKCTVVAYLLDFLSIFGILFCGHVVGIRYYQYSSTLLLKMTRDRALYSYNVRNRLVMKERPNTQRKEESNGIHGPVKAADTPLSATNETRSLTESPISISTTYL